MTTCNLDCQPVKIRLHQGQLPMVRDKINSCCFPTKRYTLSPLHLGDDNWKRASGSPPCRSGLVCPKLSTFWETSQIRSPRLEIVIRRQPQAPREGGLERTPRSRAKFTCSSGLSPFPCLALFARVRPRVCGAALARIPGRRGRRRCGPAPGELTTRLTAWPTSILHQAST